jgi:hypothetical protein
VLFPFLAGVGVGVEREEENTAGLAQLFLQKPGAALEMGNEVTASTPQPGED